MKSYQYPLTIEQCDMLLHAKWWENSTPLQIATFQMFHANLCVPSFGIFHAAVEEVLESSVWTHQFATMLDELAMAVANLNGWKEYPTQEQVLKATGLSLPQIINN